MTGANSGVGLETTKQLVKQGATVIAACRRVDVAKKVFDGLSSVDVMELDLGNLTSVRSFAENFLAQYGRLDALVNNAGIMACPEGRTADGFETQFGVNHLGHFLLTELLIDILKKSSPSRIVCLSSVAHVGMGGEPATIDFDDLFFEKRTYNRVQAYNQSKLANVLHALNLAERLEGTGVSAFSVHPGWVRTNLAHHSAPGAVFIQNVLMRPFSRLLGIMSAFDGAQTSLHCLLDDEAPNHSGEFFSQNGVLYPKGYRAGAWPMESPNPHARDKDLARKLYEVSIELVGM
ncbi:MAG: SDR family oxidoreductase [Candidatus Heimdallarchaeota archaeon]|nr:SDR family oxidoreductase [Candidatus Heimdallarchaeota archaeon]